MKDSSSLPDLPFYSGWPVAVGGPAWCLLLASLAVAFLTLVQLQPQLHTFPLTLLPAVLFASIPLLALRLVTGRHWRALFQPVRIGDLGLMVLFGCGTFLVSMLIGVLLLQHVPSTANPLAERLVSLSTGELVLTLLPTLPQLLGEELLGILPLLAVMWLCVSRLNLSRPTGLIMGLLVSALIFGAAHLPTYGWNWTQAILGIGMVHVLLTLSYIVTRNLWVSTGAHVINDWIGFLLIHVFGDTSVGQLDAAVLI